MSSDQPILGTPANFGDVVAPPANPDNEDLSAVYMQNTGVKRDAQALQSGRAGAERHRLRQAAEKEGGFKEPTTDEGLQEPSTDDDFTEQDHRDLTTKVVGGALDVVTDVAEGLLVESPRQIVGGVVDFTIQTVELADDVQSFFNDNNIPLLEFDPTKDSRRALIQTLRDLAPSDARTVTGKLVRDIASFMTGFTPILGPAAKARQAVGLTGAVSRSLTSAAAGGVALGISVDPAPAEEAYDAFIQKHPDLEDPINAYLDGQDSEERLKERLKNTAFGLGAGVLFDGAMAGFRLLRAFRAARKAGKPKPVAAATPRTSEADVAIGDPTAARVVMRRVIAGEVDAKVDAIAARRLKAAEERIRKRFPPGTLSREEITAQATLEGSQVDVNLERINSTEDVIALFDEMAQLVPLKAGRGVRNNQITQEAANLLGIGDTELLARRLGVAPNAEEVTRFRIVWASAAEQVQALAEVAAGPNAGSYDQFVFRKAVVAFEAITEQMLGARAETGRALQAWRIQVGGDAERARRITEILAASGGEEVSKELAAEIVRLGGIGASPGQLSVVMRGSFGAKTMAAVRESFVNGLLWSPKTHVVNTLSGAIVVSQQIGERAIAARFSAWRGLQNEGVEIGEAYAMFRGVMGGMKDAFKMSAEAFKDPGVLNSKLDFPFGGELRTAISSEAFGIKSTGLGRFVDFAGNVTRLPGRLLWAEDAFWKSIGYRMEVHALATRTAIRTGGTKAEIADTFASIIANPPEHIRLAGQDAALYNTFTNKAGSIAQWFMQGRELGGYANPAVFFMPFIRTPSNILAYSFERTPLAPLMSRFRESVKAGGERRDIALARMVMGSTVFATTMDYAFEGRITGNGPENKEQRESLMRQGWQPFSIRLDDKWVRYDRTDPLGLMMGTAAGMAELMKGFSLGPDNLSAFTEIGVAAMAAVSESVMNKTYFQGVANLIAALDDPKRNLPRVINRTTGALLPFSTALRAGATFIDPANPSVETPWQAVQSMIPVLRGKLPKQRDLWGEEISQDEVYGRYFDAGSPVRVTHQNPNPIDEEITEHQMGIGRIPRKTAIGPRAVPMDFHKYPRVYEELVKLAGNGIKHPATKMGALDFFNAVVTGEARHFSRDYATRSGGSEGQKRAFIRKWIGRYRRLAEKEILEDDSGRFQDAEFFQFRQEVAEKEGALPRFRQEASEFRTDNRLPGLQLP